MGRPSKETYVDALRISEREQADIIGRLEAKNARFQGDNRRTGSRLRYHIAQGLVVEITHPGGTITSYLVRPRDLSTNGISFLHGAFVYPNSPCRLIMQKVSGGSATIVGRVMRCAHVSGRAHDVGIQFHHAIRLDDYVAMDASAGESTSTELPKLQGRAMYIQDSIVDRELLRFHLRHTGLELVTCNTLAEGLEHLKKQQVDVLLSDGDLPGTTPAQVVKAVRAAGHGKGILFVAGEESSDAMKEIQSLPQVAVLIKPYAIDQLMEALTAALADVPQLPPLQSTFWSNQDMRPLIATFVHDMQEKLTEMEAQAKAGALASVTHMSLKLKGTAGGLGFEAIGAAAGELHALSKSQDQAQAVQEQITSLIRLAQAARAGLEKVETGA